MRDENIKRMSELILDAMRNDEKDIKNVEKEELKKDEEYKELYEKLSKRDKSQVVRLILKTWIKEHHEDYKNIYIV